jgi:hypothetical protein
MARRPRPRAAVLATLAAVTVIAAGCAPGPISHPTSGGAPMNRPVALGDDPGSNVVESVRRQLFGTWELVALEYAAAAGSTRVPVKASGTLIYDEYGNLTIDAHTTDPAAPVAAREANMLAFKGRAVIDTVKHELKLMNVTGNVDPDEVLSVDRRRKFEVDFQTLKLSSFDEAGTVTAISTWHRR